MRHITRKSPPNQISSPLDGYMTHTAPPQRRLSDKIIAAFHAACDENDIEIAESLLRQADCLIRQPSPPHASIERRRPQSLAAPRERLANLLLWQATKLHGHLL